MCDRCVPQAIRTRKASTHVYHSFSESSLVYVEQKLCLFCSFRLNVLEMQAFSTGEESPAPSSCQHKCYIQPKFKKYNSMWHTLFNLNRMNVHFFKTLLDK